MLIVKMAVLLIFLFQTKYRLAAGKYLPEHKSFCSHIFLYFNTAGTAQIYAGSISFTYYAIDLFLPVHAALSNTAARRFIK